MPANVTLAASVSPPPSSPPPPTPSSSTPPWLPLALEAGIPGLVVLLIVLAICIFCIRRYRRQRRIARIWQQHINGTMEPAAFGGDRRPLTSGAQARSRPCPEPILNRLRPKPIARQAAHLTVLLPLRRLPRRSLSAVVELGGEGCRCAVGMQTVPGAPCVRVYFSV